MRYKDRLLYKQKQKAYELKIRDVYILIGIPKIVKKIINYIVTKIIFQEIRSYLNLAF